MLKIYNSLTKKKEYLINSNKSKINIYLCGPTVYSHLHIGNIRSLIFFNMMKKYLKLIGIKTYLVVNITDIDDKIIKIASEKNKSEKEISSKYTLAFLKLLKTLEIKNINEIPMVTNYIEKIVSFIDELIKKKYAYITDKGIYFRINKIKNYGILSGQNLKKLKINQRKKIDNFEEKENHEDFILWKKTDIGIKFSSPWFMGRPGWHTECVVMIKEIFQNNTIDIHGGGIDLKFPHHENEQAQFLASENKPLANFFVHVGHVEYDNKKMSKSTGNIILVKDLLKKFEPNVLKLFFLKYHYLQPINFNQKLIEKTQTEYSNLLKILNKNNFKLNLKKINNFEIISDYVDKFHKIMKNDFNTPNLITIIEEILKELNKNKNLKILAQLQNTLIFVLKNINIKIILKKIDIKDIKLYNLWQKYKKNKNFKEADSIRQILLKKEII
ncbi:cysteine--tRNA ligase [Candidatus Phytoplasma palmae]|uniref:cysteine--tRNA ligase n=1 Tax=Candidatus Phytoplasma palmae TaxID=85624 RepID=UPI0039909EC6